VRIFALFLFVSSPGAAPSATPDDWAKYGDTPDAGAQVDRVVVTGGRRPERAADAVVAPEVISRREIELSGAEDVAELLDQQPGIQIDSSFAGAGIRLQGLDPEHTLILVDGMRLNGRVDGVLDLSRIPAERVERVEIIKGPASALYGSDALGGVVNIITRPPEKGFEADVHTAFGTLADDGAAAPDFGGPGTVDVSGRVAGGVDRARLSLSGGFHHQGAFDRDPRDPATTGSASDAWNVEAHGLFRLSEVARLRLRFDVFRRELEGVEQGPALEGGTDNPFRPESSRATYDRTSATTTYSAVAAPTFDLAEGHTLRVIGSFSRFEDTFQRDQRGDDAGDLSESTTDDLAQLTAQWDGRLAPRHQLTAGLEGLYERIGSERLRDGEGDRGRFSIFAQHEWRPFDPLRIAPGLRLDVDSQFGAYPAPKIAVRYDPWEQLALRASYGVGFRAPSARELLLRFENPGAGYIVEGNPDLRPEVSRGLDASAELRLADSRVTVQASFYRNDVDDLIVFVPGPPSQPQIFINDNVDRALTQGVESSMRVQWLESFGTDFGYTYLDARDLERERALPGRSPHRVTFRALLDLDDLGLSAWLRGSWVDRAPVYFDDADGARTEYVPAHVTMDARVQQRLGDHVAAFIGADNIFDAGDAELLPIAPRGFYAGLNGFY
jgi:outer membrane receptor for ferrienterochelin and colicins